MSRRLRPLVHVSPCYKISTVQHTRKPADAALVTAQLKDAGEPVLRYGHTPRSSSGQANICVNEDAMPLSQGVFVLHSDKMANGVWVEDSAMRWGQPSLERLVLVPACHLAHGLPNGDACHDRNGSAAQLCTTFHDLMLLRVG